MKKRIYTCDGGCLLIGNASFRFNLPNGFGDGHHRVYVSSDRNDIPKESRWVGKIRGDAINVYNYDCYDTLDELYENVLFTLRGEYAVYVDCGNVYFLGGLKNQRDFLL